MKLTPKIFTNSSTQNQILTSHTNTLTMYTGSPVTRGDREGIKGHRTWIIGPRGVPKDVGLPVAVMAVPLERECGANPSPRDACKREGLDKSLAKDSCIHLQYSYHSSIFHPLTKFDTLSIRSNKM